MSDCGPGFVLAELVQISRVFANVGAVSLVGEVSLHRGSGAEYQSLQRDCTGGAELTVRTDRDFIRVQTSLMRNTFMLKAN